jgi:hypothetical protein
MRLGLARPLRQAGFDRLSASAQVRVFPPSLPVFPAFFPENSSRLGFLNPEGAGDFEIRESLSAQVENAVNVPQGEFGVGVDAAGCFLCAP